MAQIIIYTGVLLLTIIAPRTSLFLFILVSPWSQYASDVLRWDPRLGWAVLLAMRAAFFEPAGTIQPLPRTAFWATACFTVIGYARLSAVGGQLSPDSLRSCKIALLYFSIGMCAAYAIVKMAQMKEHVFQVVSAGAWSLVFASGFSFFEAGTGALGARVFGTTGNPNTSAAHLAMGATVMLLCWRLKLPRRWLYGISTIMAAVACVLTFSRMGIVACLIGLTLTFQITRGMKRVNWKLAVVSVATVALCMGVARSQLASIRNTHPTASQTELAELSQEVEDLTRLEALQFSLQQFIQEPVLGVGFSTIADRNFASTGFYVTSHDTYAQVLAGTGLVGALLIALLLIGVCKGVPTINKPYLIPLSSVFAFCCFFGDFLQSIELIVAWAMLIAVLRQLSLAGERLSVG